MEHLMCKDGDLVWLGVSSWTVGNVKVHTVGRHSKVKLSKCHDNLFISWVQVKNLSNIIHVNIQKEERKSYSFYPGLTVI